MTENDLNQVNQVIETGAKDLSEEKTPAPRGKDDIIYKNFGGINSINLIRWFSPDNQESDTPVKYKFYKLSVDEITEVFNINEVFNKKPSLKEQLELLQRGKELIKAHYLDIINLRVDGHFIKFDASLFDKLPPKETLSFLDILVTGTLKPVNDVTDDEKKN